MITYVVRLHPEAREQVRALVNTGRAAAVKLLHARILLKADVGAESRRWTEAAVADAKMMYDLQLALIELDIKLAYDDFGAGQARLVELVEVCPNYLKFDRRLVHDIHRATAARQHMLLTLVRMVRELGIVPLAEGIEEAEDYETCRQLDFELAQGFFIGRPASVNHYLAPAEERDERAESIADRLVVGEISPDELASLSDSLPEPSESLSAHILSSNQKS